VVATLAAAVAVLLVAATLGSALAAWHIAAARDDEKREHDRVDVLNKQLQRLLYVADMNLAQHAWETADIGRMRELLEKHRPKPGEPDLRHFEWHYLHGLCNAPRLTFKAAMFSEVFDYPVASVAFSPDGKSFAAASWNEPDHQVEITIWDTPSGRQIRTIHERLESSHSPSIRVAFSPDGNRLASSAFVDMDHDPSVKVWDTRTGREIFSFKIWDARTSGDPKEFRSALGGLTFSPDGKRLATTGDMIDHSVRVWDAQTGREILTLKGHRQHILGVAFSPDGKRLASASGTPTVKVWDAQTGRELLTIKGNNETLFHMVTFSPDGKWLAGASSDGKILVWDARNGEEIPTSQGHTGPVLDVAFSADGKRLVSGSADGTVKVWNLVAPAVVGRPSWRTAFTVKGHSDAVFAVTFSLDGKHLASASADGTLQMWDAHTGQEPFSLKSTGGTTVDRVVFSPNGERLASTAGWDTVNVWDTRTGQETLTIKSPGARSLAFSADSLACGSRFSPGSPMPREGRPTLIRPTVHVWDARTGQERFTLLYKGPPVSEAAEVAFSPDGKSLATGEGVALKLYDSQTGREILALPGHGKAISGVAFSPNGQILASASVDDTVKVWDVPNAREILTLKGCSVAFSPDGRRIASGSLDRTVTVWDAHTGKQILTLKGHTSNVRRLTFSSDGERLASLASEVKVWDAHTGQETLTLKGRSASSNYLLRSPFNDVAFSPDSRLLATAGNDGTVKVWGHLAARIP
jgi:WD40 repeat protein